MRLQLHVRQEQLLKKQKTTQKTTSDTETTATALFGTSTPASSDTEPTTGGH